jgi:cyanophycin synthetase
VHTIAELIDLANRDPLRGEGHEKPLTKIKVDDIVRAYLKKTGLGLDYVAREGEIVHLRESINLSTGGVARDVTDEVHESVRLMCERVARIMGLDVCGVDLVLTDIGVPLRRGVGGVIEVNASPGLRMHQHPSEGRPRDVGTPIVEMLFPDGDDGRIPIISVTGTNGKTTVTRMIAHVLSTTGLVTGVTTTDGIYINNQLIVEGDTTGPHSARTILTDPSVEAAVLEMTRDGIARHGLGYDWSDISVMTNIQPDHFGQDGIDSIEDLIFIKSLVAERVIAGGTLVLNADDEHLARLMDEPRVRRTPKRVVYFSLRENHLLLKKHASSGGTVYFVRNDWIIEKTGAVERRILDATRVPVTMSGTAQFQIANLLACVAACRAHGVAVEQFAPALSSFESASRNPGRTSPTDRIEDLEVRPAARAAVANVPLYIPARTTTPPAPLLMAARREHDHEGQSYIWR